MNIKKPDFELPPIKKTDVIGEQSFFDRANDNENYTFENEDKREQFKNQLINKETVEKWIQCAFNGNVLKVKKME